MSHMFLDFQILSFYQSLKGMLVRALSGDDFIEIKKMQLTYFSFTNIYGLSCLGYYEGSLDAITNAMEENLGLTTPETIKTLSYDYSVDYEQDSETIGKGVYSGGKVPDSSVTNPSTPEESDPVEDPDPVEEDPTEPSETPEDPDSNEDPDNETDPEDPDIPGTPGDEPTEPGETPDDPDSSDENTGDGEDPVTPGDGEDNTPSTPGEPTEEN